MKFIKQQRETRNIVEIYNGTDPIRPLPVYAKSVDTSISPPPYGGGANWHKDYPNGTDNLPPCTFDMLKVKDPFNNRKLINEFSKGYFGIYIWTYNPTGVCLVGQSTRKTPPYGR